MAFVTKMQITFNAAPRISAVFNTVGGRKEQPSKRAGGDQRPPSHLHPGSITHSGPLR